MTPPYAKNLVLPVFLLLTLFGLTYSTPCQDWAERVRAVKIPHFKVVNAGDVFADFGRSDNGGSEYAKGLIFVYVSPDHVNKKSIGNFLRVIKPKLSKRHDYAIYFFDDFDRAKNFDDSSEDEEKNMKAVKGIFFRILERKREILQVYKDGFTEENINILEKKLKK